MSPQLEGALYLLAAEAAIGIVLIVIFTYKINAGTRKLKHKEFDKDRDQKKSK